MACSGYPACKNTRPLPEEQERFQHLAGIKCELDGGDMVVRSSKFGTFLGSLQLSEVQEHQAHFDGNEVPQM